VFRCPPDPIGSYSQKTGRGFRPSRSISKYISVKKQRNCRNGAHDVRAHQVLAPLRLRMQGEDHRSQLWNAVDQFITEANFHKAPPARKHTDQPIGRALYRET